MWVFGYGSLMWDDWYGSLSCTRKTIGLMRGYRRTFSKNSVRNWGTKQRPGPTNARTPMEGDYVRGDEQ